MIYQIYGDGSGYLRGDDFADDLASDPKTLTLWTRHCRATTWFARSLYSDRQVTDEQIEAMIERAWGGVETVTHSPEAECVNRAIELLEIAISHQGGKPRTVPCGTVLRKSNTHSVAICEE